MRYFLDLPNSEERLSILDLHLKKGDQVTVFLFPPLIEQMDSQVQNSNKQ